MARGICVPLVLPSVGRFTKSLVRPRASSSSSSFSLIIHALSNVVTLLMIGEEESRVVVVGKG